MKIELTLDDDAVDALAGALAKAMNGGKTPAAAPKGGKKKAEAAKAEAEEVDTGETDTDETDTNDGEQDNADAGEGEDFGETTDAKIERDDVLAALKKVSSEIDQEAAMAILKKTGGASKLSSLVEGKFEAVIKACETALKKAKK